MAPGRWHYDLDMNDPRLILLPGLGADARLFEPQRRAFPRLETPRWLPPRRGESLSGYAARMAEQVDTREPYVLGGVSLGGMVALEMARHLRPDAVLLIGSCRRGQTVRRDLRRIEPLHPLVPAALFELCKPLAPLLVLGLPNDLKDLFVTMFRDTPAAFLKWACSAVVRWPGPPPPEAPEPPELRVPVYRIHGRRDALLPLNDEPADEVIEDGHHLISLTHAEKVNAFIRSRLARHRRSP